MKDCDICNILKNKESFHLFYEDEVCFGILHENPAIPGHTLLIPKNHAAIIEELDDKTVNHLFVIANKISTALFENLGAHGTNIVINNGIDAGQELPHIVVNILPRKENDGVNFEWPPNKASESQLKTTQSMMSVYADPIFAGKDILPDVKIEEHKKEDDFLVKSLTRIP